MGTGSRQLQEPVRAWGQARANFSRQVPCIFPPVVISYHHRAPMTASW
ncbi:hypothetical protein L530_0087, partial [Bordetella bronchiseptica MO211]